MQKVSELQVGQVVKVSMPDYDRIAIVTATTRAKNDVAGRVLVKIEPLPHTKDWYGYHFVTDDKIMYPDEIHISRLYNQV